MSLREHLLTIVVPAYNEEDNIEKFIEEIIPYLEKNSWLLIVVNDGSKDKTLSLLNNYQSHSLIKILNNKVNGGYGGAIKKGIRKVTTGYVITVDADGQHSPADIEKLYKKVLNEDADMVVGKRDDAKSSFFRLVGKFFIRFFAKIMMYVPIKDINSGMKIYKSSIVKRYLHLCPDNMAFSDIITLIFISMRHLVLEEPIDVRERKAGVSTIGFMTAVETISAIVSIVMLFKPLKIFFPISLLFIMSGLAWGTPIILEGKGVSTGTALLLSNGIVIFLLGLIAEQLAKIRINQRNEDI